MHFTSTRNILKVALAAALSLAFVTSAYAVGGPLTGELRVKNERYRAVTVYLDGARATQLGPGQKKVFRHVPNGIRVVSIVSPRGHELSERIQVDIGRRSRLKVAPRLGTALIKNKSGIDMRVTIAGRDLGVVRDGQRQLTNPLRPGNYTLTAYPMGVHGAGKPLVKRFDVVAGQERSVRLKPYIASLRITNPFPHRVGVRLNGVRSGRIRAGQTMVLSGQLPGPVTVTLARQGQTVAQANLTLLPGQNASWAPHYAHTGDLRIRNAAPVAMRVKVNGVRHGRLAPGQVKIIRDVPAGPVTITGRTDHGRTFAKTVHVAPAEVARVRLTGNMPVAQAGYGHGY